MLINDPIGDALSRIRNAQLRNKKTVNIPLTRIVESIILILKQEKYIDDYKVNKVEGNKQSEIEVVLRYSDDKPALTFLKRISKPGLRKYIGYKDIPKVLNGFGISILTTPKGIMTGVKAKEEKVGGEYLCSIY